MPHTSDYTGNTVITYDFFSFYWKPGIVWRYGFTDRIHLGIDAWFCLYRFDHALDIHYVANVPHDYYTDIVEKWFSGLDVRATANYAFTDHFSLSLRVAGVFLPPAYDDDYVGVPPDTKDIGIVCTDCMQIMRSALRRDVARATRKWAILRKVCSCISTFR